MSVGGSRKETVQAGDIQIAATVTNMTPVHSALSCRSTNSKRRRSRSDRWLIVEPASDSRDVSGDFQMTKSARVQALRGVA
jgi:hypothetical protein